MIIYLRTKVYKQGFDIFNETHTEGNQTKVSFAVTKIGNTKVFVHVTFVLAGIVMISTGYALYFVVFAGSLIIHEIGHLIAASFLEIEITEIEVWAFGAVAKFDGIWQIEPWPEAIIAISGPLQSAFLASLGFLTYFSYTSSLFGVHTFSQLPLLEFLIRINLGLLAVNLLPCLPLDGGRFFRAQLSLKVGYKNASYKICNLSIYTGMFLSMLGIVGTVLGKSWYNLMVFGPLLIWGALKERQVISFGNIMAILSRNHRLAKRGTLPIKELLVYQDTAVKELVYRLRPSKYYMLMVVDNQMQPVGFVTETDLLEAFYKGLMGMCVKELVNPL